MAHLVLTAKEKPFDFRAIEEKLRAGRILKTEESGFIDLAEDRHPPEVWCSVNSVPKDGKLRAFMLWLLDTYECEGENDDGHHFHSSEECKQWVNDWLGA